LCGDTPRKSCPECTAFCPRRTATLPPLHIARDRTPLSWRCYTSVVRVCWLLCAATGRQRHAMPSEPVRTGSEGIGSAWEIWERLQGTRRQSCAPWLLWPPSAPPAAWSVVCPPVSSSRRRAQRARVFRLTKTHLALCPPWGAHRAATAGERHGGNARPRRVFLPLGGVCRVRAALRGKAPTLAVGLSA